MNIIVRNKNSRALDSLTINWEFETNNFFLFFYFTFKFCYYENLCYTVKLAKARRGMIKEKEKGGGARLKDEPNDPAEPGIYHDYLLQDYSEWMVYEQIVK